MQLPSRKPDYAAISESVDVEFACKHTHKIVRKKLAADGAISIGHQCVRCGNKVGIAIKKASMMPAQVAALPVWDTQLESGFYAQKKKRFDEVFASETKRYADIWQTAYAVYLKSPQWKRKRQLVMTRAQDICEGCREVKADDVHHFSYDTAGDEFLFQLAALCRKCHERWHGLVEPSVLTPRPTPMRPSPVPPLVS